MAAGKVTLQVGEELDKLCRMLSAIRTIEENQPIGIIKLSEILGLPRHKIRYLLRLLENDGVIAPSSNGCVLNPGYEEYVEDQLAELEKIRARIGEIESSAQRKRNRSKLFYSDLSYGNCLAWPGRLACPIPEIVNMRGRQQGTAPLNHQAHRVTMISCPVESE